MGLGDKQRGGNNYVSIYDGSIVREWRKKKPSEDQLPAGKELEEREISMGPNKGNTIWFIRFDFLGGLIDKLILDESGDWGDTIEINVNDVGDNYVLQVKADSSYGKDFLKKLNNIDRSQEVELSPWVMTPKEWFDLTGKTVKGNRSGLAIKQNGEKIESFYTKDNPNGLPELVEKKTRKGVTWDGTDQLNFLLDNLEAVIKGFDSSSTSVAPKTTTVKEPVTETIEKSEDLPF